MVKMRGRQRVIAFYYANGGLFARGIDKLPVVKQVGKKFLDLLLPAIKNCLAYLKSNR
jgi:hypothetical protein